MLELLFLSLIGGAGLSFMFGGDDEPDEVVYDQENGLITGTDGDDLITSTYEDGNLDDLTIDAGAGDDEIDLLGDPDDLNWLENSEINGEDGDDTIVLDHTYGVTVDGGVGDDTIITEGTYYSTLNGGDGDDYIDSGNTSGDATTVNGGAGDDAIDGSGMSNGSLNGGDGDDTIYTGVGAFYGAGYSTTTDGGAGDDTIIYENEGEIFGIDHYQTILGGEGVDTFELTVDQGGGTIYGTAPIDIMYLGDFEPDVEVLQIETIPDDGYAVSAATLTENTDDTTLTLTYAHPTEGEVSRVIGIGATGVTWDDINFVGGTPPAVLTPLA